MRISARADYALRAAAELAAAGGGPVKGDALATAQNIPHKFLENILADLRHARLVRSQRGADGGYWLAQPGEELSRAPAILAVAGPPGRPPGGAATGSRSGPSRSRSPTSSARSRARWPASGGRRRRTSSTPAPPSTCRTSGSRSAPACARWSRTSRSPTSRRASCRRRSSGLGTTLRRGCGVEPHDRAGLGLERVGLGARQLNRDLLAVRAHDLNAHLEAEVHDALDHDLLPALLGAV